MKRLLLVIPLILLFAVYGSAFPPTAPQPTEATSIQDDLIVNADVNTSAAIAQSKLVDVVNADVDAAAAIAFSKLATIISDNKEVQNNIRWSFGDDDDASWFWDATNSILSLETSAGEVILWIDLANKSLNMIAVASPESSDYDSDADGAERTDEYAGGRGSNMTDTTEDAEISDVTIYYMDAGTKRAAITIDGDGDITFHGSRPLVTTGTIQGRNVVGADITGNTAHDVAELHGVIYKATAAATVTLDAAADAGFGACASYRIRDAAEKLVLDLDNAEKFNLAGTALAAGVAIEATGAGEYCTVCATTDSDGSGTDGYDVYGETSGWATE